MYSSTSNLAPLKLPMPQIARRIKLDVDVLSALRRANLCVGMVCPLYVLPLYTMFGMKTPANFVTEVLDQRALLAIQHVCNQEAVKIPWTKVAAVLGATVTEGALVQHLAKLRNKLEKDGVAVTPPLKRGGKNASANTKTLADKGAVAKRTSSKLSKEDEDGDDDSDGALITKKKSNAQGKKKETGSDSDDEPLAKKKRKAQGKKKETDSDSDSEPLAKRKRPNQPKKGSNAESKKDKTGSKEKARAKGQSGSVKIKSEQDDVSVSKSSTKKADKRKLIQQGTLGELEIAKLNVGRVEVKSEDADVDDYANDTDMDENNEDVVAIGAPFLAQEWSGESVSSVSSNSTEITSRVVALQVGQGNAELIEAWQNNEEISGSNDHDQNSSYARPPADGSAQLHSHHDQYDDGPVNSSMMMFGNDTEMLSNPGAFNNQTFGNNYDPGFDMGDLGFANLSAAVNQGDSAQFDNSNVAEYGTFQNPCDFDINGSGDQGVGISGVGGYQYGSAIRNSGNISQTINPLDLHTPGNGGHDFGHGFGQFGPPNQGMGYTGSSFAPPSTNMGFNSSTGGHRPGVAALAPKHTSHGNDKVSKGGVRNASNGGFGAASSSHAGRRDDRSERKGFKQEKSAKQAGQSYTGNNSLAGMPVAPFDQTLPMYDLSSDVKFNNSNQNGIPDWLEGQKFDWTNYLNEDNHDPFGGIS